MEDLAEMNALLDRVFGETAESVATALGVFTRVAAAAFLVPGMGEQAVPLRLRLGIAVAITLALAPLIRPLVPETPQDLPGLAAMLAAEAVAGLAIGLAFRLIIQALQIAGTTAAYHLSLTHIFGGGVAPEPEPTIATFLALGGIVIAMNAGLHVAVIAALADLYTILPFGRPPDAADLAGWSVGRIAEVFALGIALAFPFIAISFAYNLALGALSRAMPQLMVVLVGVPLLVLLGLGTLWLALPAIFARWGADLGQLFANPFGSL